MDLEDLESLVRIPYILAMTMAGDEWEVHDEPLPHPPESATHWYVGVTSDIHRRWMQHFSRTGQHPEWLRDKAILRMMVPDRSGAWVWVKPDTCSGEVAWEPPTDDARERVRIDAQGCLGNAAFRVERRILHEVMYADVNPTGARRGLTCVKSGELVETLMLCDHPLEHAERTRALYVDACAVCGASDHTAKHCMRRGEAAARNEE